MLPLRPAAQAFARPPQGISGAAAEGAGSEPRFEATVDLRSPNFRPGRHFHDRVQQCLQAHGAAAPAAPRYAPQAARHRGCCPRSAPERPLDFLVARCTPDGAPLQLLFPPSAAAVQLPVTQRAEWLDGLCMPVLQSVFGGSAVDAATAAGDADSLRELHAWLGGVSARALRCRARTEAGWRAMPDAPTAQPGGLLQPDFPPTWPTEPDAGAELHTWTGLLCAEQARRLRRRAPRRLRMSATAEALARP